MSLVYYLVCHERSLAVAIGDDAAGDPFVWAEQIPHINTFLTLTRGTAFITVHDGEPNYNDWYDKYLILGEFE